MSSIRCRERFKVSQVVAELEARKVGGCGSRQTSECSPVDPASLLLARRRARCPASRPRLAYHRAGRRAHPRPHRLLLELMDSSHPHYSVLSLRSPRSPSTPVPIDRRVQRPRLAQKLRCAFRMTPAYCSPRMMMSVWRRMTRQRLGASRHPRPRTSARSARSASSCARHFPPGNPAAGSATTKRHVVAR
jgi:hypothetical protein